MSSTHRFLRLGIAISGLLVLTLFSALRPALAIEAQRVPVDVPVLDLTDVYMTVFFPTNEAGRLRIGSEARVIFDAAPQYVVPATVTFVASEAQFTPKYVETKIEREKLMFRVKLSLPAEILAAHENVVKTGVPGVGYVKLSEDAVWPKRLSVTLPQ